MKPKKDRQITEHFSLFEFVEGKVLIPEAIALNWKHIKELDEDNMLAILNSIETDRVEINKEFREENGGIEIGIRITSAFRCEAWEIIKKRKVPSRHSKSYAVDYVPITRKPELAIKIMDWLEKKHKPRTGWQGGFARKSPTYKDGKLIKTGFIHKDLQKPLARWDY